MKLYQIDNKLVVSEKERPRIIDYEFSTHIFDKDLAEWKKQAVEVAEEEKGKFKDLAAFKMGTEIDKWLTQHSISFTEALQHGILLPQGCYEIKIMSGEDLVMCKTKCDNCGCKEFAYFVNPKKEEAVNEGVKKRGEIITLLEKYSIFLQDSGYLDTDWNTEPPFAIDEFMKTLTPKQ